MKETEDKEVTMKIQTSAQPPLADAFTTWMREGIRANRFGIPTGVQFDPEDMKISMPAGLVFLQDCWAKACVGAFIAINNPLPNQTGEDVVEIMRATVARRLEQHMADDGDLFFRYSAWVDLQLYNGEDEGNPEEVMKKNLGALAKYCAVAAYDTATANAETLRDDIMLNPHLRETLHASVARTEEALNMGESDLQNMLKGEVATDNEEDFDEDFVGEWG
jgi:hypothetical protein|tara:strand:+ start:328 stop:987 length:660 start_codon:yes stop_codon:yes gene_type:complete